MQSKEEAKFPGPGVHERVRSPLLFWLLLLSFMLHISFQVSWFLFHDLRFQKCFTSRAGLLQGATRPGEAPLANRLYQVRSSWTFSRSIFQMFGPPASYQKNMFFDTRPKSQTKESIDPCALKARFVVGFIRRTAPGWRACEIRWHQPKVSESSTGWAGQPLPWHCQKSTLAWARLDWFLHFVGHKIQHDFLTFVFQFCQSFCLHVGLHVGTIFHPFGITVSSIQHWVL